MRLIEYLLVVAGERIAYALAADGQRVHPGNAYRAVALSAPVPDGAAVYAVECGGPAIPAGAVVIDHHRPGDPGYGRPPEYFLPASSVGQVIAELARSGSLPWPQWGGIHTLRRAGEFCGPGEPPVTATEQEIRGAWHVAGAGTGIRNGVRAVPIPTQYVLAAAADHCLAAAYRGECPGVDPDALMHWRIAVRAAHQGRNVEDVMVDVDRARVRLREAPRILLAERVASRDLRGEHVPELPEAAAREGLAYIATVTDRDGRRKIVLGAADAETVRAFMERWAPCEGLVDIYGDPARGFAGGYVAGAGAEATERMDG